MHRVIDQLMTEHRLIEQVLTALEAYAAAVARGDDVDRDDLGKFVTFICEYADRKHHAKEEDLLFPAMHDHGFPREAGPVAVMLHEHDQGREQVAVLAEIAGGDDWPADAADRIGQAAGGFAQLLHAHVDKEDTILYPMAMRAIPADAFETLSTRSDEVERRYADSGDTARLEALARELTQRYA